MRNGTVIACRSMNISYFSNALNQLHHHIQIIQVKQSLGPSASLLKCCPVYHHSAGTGAVHSIFLNQVLRFDESDFPRRFSGSVSYYDYFTRLELCARAEFTAS